MSVLRSVQSRLVSTWQARSIRSVEPESAGSHRPATWRRVGASLIDRLLPLPFLAWFFPEWTLVVLVYQLMSDSAPSGRSVGKRVLRLRAVSDQSLEPCGLWRGVLRRSAAALSQAGYCLLGWWTGLWMAAAAYDLLSFACVCLDPQGRRPEDYLAGTRVVTEKVYRRAKRRCGGCGEAADSDARFCPRCGAEVDARMSGLSSQPETNRRRAL